MVALLLLRNRQRATGEKICSFLKKHFVSTTIFTSPTEFWSVISQSEKNQIDFVLIDFSVYQFDVFNPYEEMMRMKNMVPVILYNDPYPRTKERAVFWRTKNKYYFPGLMTEERTEKLMKILQPLQEFLSGPINPSVSIICQPQDSGESQECFNINVENFCRAKSITSSRKKVFNYFISHLEESISTEELSMFLWNEKSDKRTKTIYLYIHDLREALLQDKALRLSLERDEKEHYRMRRIPKPFDESNLQKAEDFFIQKKMYSISFTPEKEEYRAKFK